MGVRPPSDDGLDDGPATVEFGIAALDARIDDDEISFPATVEEIRETHGDRPVAIDPGGTTVALGAILDRSDRDRFDSKQDMLNALHPIFEAERERRSGGVLARLRSLVPF